MNGQAQDFQTLKLNDKKTQQLLNQSPNLNVLKKMFARPKNYMTIKPSEQSLLFDRNSSLSVLKAYRNKKKIAYEQSSKKKQNELSNRFYFQSTIDSPEKANFFLQSVKYNFENSSKRQKNYEEILKMIENAKFSQDKKIQKNSNQTNIFPKNKNKSIDNHFVRNQYLIKSLNLNQKQIPRLSPKKVHSSTLEPRQKVKKQYETFQMPSVKTAKQQFLDLEIKTDDQNKQKIPLNPQNKKDDQKQEQKNMPKIVDPQKIKKQILSALNDFSLPKIKAVRSSVKIEMQSKNIRKGYMSFHPEAKIYIKQNRSKFNIEPKMSSLMISGITATSFAVLDLQTMAPIALRNFNKKIQIASISKIMTCYLCLLACKKYEIDAKKYIVRVSRQATELNGTSAQLQHGDCLTLQDALYGLMLPSGNDASYVIAQTIGKIIQRHKTKQTKKSYYETFIAHMNILSRELKLEQQWRNSSGLPLNPNHSTPQAICLLTIVAMMDQKFKAIVSCKEYEAVVKNQRTGLKKYLKWKNTNKLLNQGWQGVKTGTTDSAGHCLMAKKDRYLIAVFNSNSLSKRFTQCSQLYSLIKSKQRYLFPQKWD